MTKNKQRDYYIENLDLPRTPRQGDRPKPWSETNVVGQSRPRVDAYDRVSGAAIYPSDVVLPDMLFGAILRCPHPSARLESIDTSPAAEISGVHAVICKNDREGRIDWERNGGEKGPLFDSDCLFQGEAVAAVAAETPHLAADALRAVDVSWNVRSAVTDFTGALEEGATEVHPGGNEVKTERHERGDVQQGFSEADAVVEQTFTTAAELHTPMELHGCVANWDGRQLTIWESTQGVYAVQQKVAQTLGLALSNVRVIGHYMGGGFGSKLWASKYTVIAALLARKTGRPVKLFLSREETYLAMGNRPPSRMRLKAGVNKDGRLTALDFKCTATGGAYKAGGIALIDWLVRDLYTCPNVRTECTDVYINAGPARPFRAPGHPQTAFALEQVIDALARKIEMDPVELRLKNIPKVSQARAGSPPYTTTGLKSCLERGAEAFGWKKASAPKRKQSQKHKRRGVGVASCQWFAGGGGPPSTVIVRMHSDGTINLNMGASDIGTGTKTVMAMVAAEELGIQPDAIQIENADTGTTQYATPSGGSKTVPTESPAVRAAAIDLKQQLLKMAAKQLSVPRRNLAFEGKRITAKGAPDKKVELTNLEQLQKRGVAIGVGYRHPNPPKKVISPFAAQFCEVEVDTLTGEVQVLRFVGAHESGRVLDRLTFDNQVFGGITMGIGFGMTEQRILDDETGKLLTHNWHDYKLPTALDVPLDMTSVAVEPNDTEANTTGAKGLGEPVTIPTAAAIANAIHDAIGIRPVDAPITPMRLLSLLADRRDQTGEEG